MPSRYSPQLTPGNGGQGQCSRGARVVEMGPPGTIFMVRKPPGAQRREGTAESLKGALSWEEAWVPDMRGRPAGWSLCGSEGKCARAGQEGRQVGEGPRAGLVCDHGPQPTGALSSTLQHSASRGTACRRDGCSEGSSLGPWAPQTGGSCSPAGTRHTRMDPRPEHCGVECAQVGLASIH